MNKNFFSEHESFIDKIANEIMNSDKDWIIDEFQNVYTDIINEIKDSGINLPATANSKYFLLYAASLHIEENNKYLHISFIFNFKNEQVLIMPIYTDTGDINLKEINIAKINSYMESDKKRIKEFFKYANQLNIDFNDLVNYADLIKEKLFIYENRKYRYPCLGNFFNILSAKEMLKFLGYCLYVYWCSPETKKYCHILNIVYSKQNVEYKDIKAFCSFIHKMVTDDEPSDKNFIAGKNLDSKNIIDALDNTNDKMVFIYYVKTPQKKSIECVTRFLDILKSNKSSLSKKKYKKLYEKKIVIISTEPADNNMIPVFFENYNKSNLIMSKKKSDIIDDLFCEFNEYFINYYFSPFNFSNKDDEIVNNSINSLKEKIYHETDLSENDCKKYAPILFLIEGLLKFMKDRAYVSAKGYEVYEKIYRSIMEEESDITNTQPEIDTDITLDFVIAIYDLYQKQRELFFEHNKDNTQTPFI